MKVGRKIGEGGNAEVFEWDNNNKVIKLAKSNINKMSLQREYNNNLTAWKLGLSVPQPIEIVEFRNRPGIVFERIHGATLKDRLFKNLIEHNNVDQPNIDWNDVLLTARLLSKVHNQCCNNLPLQREYIKKQIHSVNYLNENEKETVIGNLDSLPIKKQVCHGDPNPNNIFMRNGEPVLIDWMDATNGNPEADIAEYIIMIKFAVLPPNTPQNVVRQFDSIRGKIIEVFIEEYTLLTGITYDKVEPWIAPIAARKLSADAISEEEKQLLLNEIRLRLEIKK